MIARMLKQFRFFILTAVAATLVGVGGEQTQAKEPPKPTRIESQAEVTKGPYRRRARRYYRGNYRRDYYDYRYRGRYDNRYYNGGGVRVGPVRVWW